jgi:4-hydroxybenzoate polyprenyltransferase
MLFLASVPLIIIYSKYRLKEIFILKNIYTGAGTGFVLVIGASASGTLTGAVIYPFIATFFFGIMANMLGDIRGYAGDLAAGVKTLPVKMGLVPTARIFHTMMLGLSICILFGYRAFLPIVPFTILISFFLAAGMNRAARYTLLCTFVSLSAFILMVKIQGF